MTASLENNPHIIKQLRRATEVAAFQEYPALAALLQIAADQLEHTHNIATAGWLETQEAL